jgi:hypothetical protein
MSAADRSRPDAPDLDGLAARCREAGFVRLVAAPDGDSLAAAGLLARGLESPFQVSVTADPVDGTGEETDLTVAVGRDGGDVALRSAPLSAAAYAVARELSGAPDPVLALAGVVADGGEPGAHAGLLEATGAAREPGIGVPTGDVADGLAHSTLVHAPFSGDPEAAARALAGVDRNGRSVASAAVLSALGAEATPRAAEAVERLLRPYTLDGSAPFRTLAGYADVLSAVAREQPGTGVALALGYGDGRTGEADRSYDAREPALAAWREHATRAHRAVREADVARHRGLVVAELPPRAPARTAARLLRDYRSPEPVVATVTDETVAVAGLDPVENHAREAAEAAGGRLVGRGRLVAVRLGGADAGPAVERLREVVA